MCKPEINLTKSKSHAHTLHRLFTKIILSIGSLRAHTVHRALMRAHTQGLHKDALVHKVLTRTPVMSEYHKMDTNKYPNILRCHIMYRTNTQIYSDATYLPNKYPNIFIRWS